jgi:hypothetical protein
MLPRWLIGLDVDELGRALKIVDEGAVDVRSAWTDAKAGLRPRGPRSPGVTPGAATMPWWVFLFGQKNM